MNIYMTGIDHEAAPLDVRAEFSFTKTKTMEALQVLKNIDGVLGAVLISTCNRTECWVSAADGRALPLYETLCGIKGLHGAPYRGYFQEKRDKEAVRHLFFLTSGLKSQILGEDQVLSQVRDALALSRACFCTDSVLEVLFRMAVTAGKRVKTEVAFPRAGQTAVDAAVRMLQNRGIRLEGRRCLVIGNGEMGKLAATGLKRHGADVTVTVRQYRSGMVMIPEGCRRIDYGKRMALLPDCDFVVSATVSPNQTVTRALLEKYGWKNGLICFDLAVPRDIEPAVNALDGLEVYDLDDLKAAEEGKTDAFGLDGRSASDAGQADAFGLDGRKASALARAEQILYEEMAAFDSWLDGRDFLTRMQEIQMQAAADFRFRMQKNVKKLPISESEQDALLESMEQAAGKVIAKLVYGVRDTASKESLRACIEGMEHAYRRESTIYGPKK